LVVLENVEISEIVVYWTKWSVLGKTLVPQWFPGLLRPENGCNVQLKITLQWRTFLRFLSPYEQYSFSFFVLRSQCHANETHELSGFHTVAFWHNQRNWGLF